MQIKNNGIGNHGNPMPFILSKNLFFGKMMAVEKGSQTVFSSTDGVQRYVDGRKNAE